MKPTRMSKEEQLRMDASTVDKERNHLRVYPLCGACGDHISRHERVVAVRGNNDSTLYEAHTRPFPFPQPGYLVTPVDGYALCRYYECSRCEASPEFVAVHHECFEIFSQRCTIARTDAMRRLWVLAAWRRPWRRAQPVYFPAPTVDKDILATVSSRCGLPLLHTLPTEILDMIRAYSPHSLLWRCLVVLELADFVSTTDPQPLITLPVREIQSWHRNGTLQRVTGPPSQLPILITVDSTGVSKIERLPVAPTYAGECSTRSMFALLYPSLPAEFVAHSKDGRLRLALPDGYAPLKVWNTPGPPSAALTRAVPADMASCQVLRAIEMDNIKGVTFFFSHVLTGIHIHHTHESCAMETCARDFSNRARRGLVWIYLPRSKRDRILDLGVREVMGSTSRRILVRTRLSGDIVIGKQHNHAVRDTCLAASAPVTMLYGDPKPGRQISFFGAHCRAPSGPGRAALFRIVRPGNSPIDEEPYVSWAPLDDVAAAEVFTNQTTGACKGILLRYQNGGARSVGQCRVHVDPSETVTQPNQIRFKVDASSPGENETVYTVQVTFSKADAAHGAAEDHKGWEVRPMKGLLKFWFTVESSFVAVGD